VQSARGLLHGGSQWLISLIKDSLFWSQVHLFLWNNTLVRVQIGVLLPVRMRSKLKQKSKYVPHNTKNYKSYLKLTNCQSLLKRTANIQINRAFTKERAPKLLYKFLSTQPTFLIFRFLYFQSWYSLRCTQPFSLGTPQAPLFLVMSRSSSSPLLLHSILQINYVSLLAQELASCSSY